MAILLDYCSALPSHTTNKSSDALLQDSSPLIQQCLSEPLNYGWLDWAGRYCCLQHVPGMFNWMKVWGPCWPVHSVYSCCLQVLVGDPCLLWRALSSIINEIRAYSTSVWVNIHIQDLIDVLSSCQCVILNDLQSIFPCMLIPAHTITIIVARHKGAKYSFKDLHSSTCLSVKSTQTLDLSVNNTGVQTFSVHLTRVCAHWRRAWMWFRINGMQIAVCLDIVPPL